jgi:DNA polymerase III subunit gamma/tau
MSYQVTARKWRPQTFAELVGQRHVARTLQNALSQARIAHAYLFTGTRGTGKTTTARILAKALNCEQGPSPEPCNRCALCQAITLGNALDVMEIDGASNRGIDEIRDLREKIRYAPARSRYKIYIIDEVHMLTEHAFNALLKTLEEPPPQVVFIFATTEPQKVPITILSRCQRFDFHKVTSTEIAHCLGKIAEQEGVHISEIALHRIGRRAQGSLRDAQTLFDQVVAYCGLEVPDNEVEQLLGLAGEDQILHLLEAIMARHACKVLELLTQIFQQGHDTRELCRYLLELLRDLLVVKVAPKGHGGLDRSPTEFESLQKLASQSSIEELHTLFELLTTTEMRVRDSAQPIWMLEVSLIKLASLPPLQPLGVLVTRLESLERRLGLTSERDAYEIPSLTTAVHETTTASEASAATTTPTVLSPSPLAVPPDGVEQPASPSEVVRKIIEGASTRALGWILEQHCKMHVTDSSLEVTFHGNNRMAHELLHDEGTLRTLQQLLRTALGREMEVRIIDAPALNDEGDRAVTNTASPDENLFALTRAPIVRETLELFGGRILDVRSRTASRDARGRPISEDEMVSQEDMDDE